MPAIFTIQSLVILAAYFILMYLFFAGWGLTKRFKPDQKPGSARVTILIPCKNEAANIEELTALLDCQEYQTDLIDIIWIDDHSGDGSSLIFEKILRNRPHMRLIELAGQTSGKKEALKAGMKIAQGELILLTDADSRPGPRWVSSMARFFEDSATDLILGPVALGPALRPFDQIQKLEYLSLVASSIGAAGIGMPFMAQGPNLGVRGSDYRKLVSDLDNRFLSGDDVFLLQSMKKLPGKKIGYLLHPDAIVHSKPARSLSDFLHQRQRWASKAKGYNDLHMITTTILVFVANLEILVTLIGALTGLLPFSLLFILVGIKTLADLPLVFRAATFFRCRALMAWFIPLQLVYPIYIFMAATLSQFAPIRWKKQTS